MAQRRAVLVSQVKAWPKATKQEKSAILDHVCAVNGWHRDHARKMLRRAVAGVLREEPRAGREPVYRYSAEVIEALVVLGGIGWPDGEGVGTGVAGVGAGVGGGGGAPGPGRGDRGVVGDVVGHDGSPVAAVSHGVGRVAEGAVDDPAGGVC